MIPRTVLPRKGIIQPLHGAQAAWESDSDSNCALLDANVAFYTDLLDRSLGINGIVSGFTLLTSSNLIPGLTAGELFAQGQRYITASPVSLAPTTPSTTRYVWGTPAGTFYYTASLAPSTAGDAFIGSVVAGASTVTAVNLATHIAGFLSVTAPNDGNFSFAHMLGRAPVKALIYMTSPGIIWWQSGRFNTTDLLLTASNAGLTADVQLF